MAPRQLDTRSNSSRHAQVGHLGPEATHGITLEHDIEVAEEYPSDEDSEHLY
jgi:hypothetical protein